MSKKYEGHDWIKFKRAKAVEISGKKYVSEKHHIEETSFLIEEIKKLVSIIDNKDALIRKLRSFQDRQRQQAKRDYLYRSDYLPYEEDDRS